MTLEWMSQEELEKHHEQRLRLLEIGLNRRFPDMAEWSCAFDERGDDVVVTTGKGKRFYIPQCVCFGKPNVLEVFNWFVKAVGLDNMKGQV